MDAIADTGVGVSVITRAVVDRVNSIHKNRLKIVPMSVKVDAANGTALDIEGAVCVTFWLES